MKTFLYVTLIIAIAGECSLKAEEKESRRVRSIRLKNAKQKAFNVQKARGENIFKWS